MRCRGEKFAILCAPHKTHIRNKATEREIVLKRRLSTLV